jgi:hypothetical protein
MNFCFFRAHRAKLKGMEKYKISAGECFTKMNYENMKLLANFEFR